MSAEGALPRSTGPSASACGGGGIEDPLAAGRRGESRHRALRSLLVAGTGLIGTSIGLAARARGLEVWLVDVDPRHLSAAEEIGAGRRAPLDRPPRVDHAVVCVPPDAVGEVTAALQRQAVASTFSDCCGVKAHLLAEDQELDHTSFVGGHPMAGRERGGPWHARADLFHGRPWVLTPCVCSAPEAVAAATELAELCGADVLTRSAAEHDRAVAAVSQLPQLLASVLAARLRDVSPEDLELAGQGVSDMTRIADSDPALWVGLLTTNAGQVLPVLRGVTADLARVQGVLSDLSAVHAAGTTAAEGATADTQSEASAAEAIGDLLARGNEGRRRLPAKHGGRRPDYARLVVPVPDQPGELARILAQLAQRHINLEDIVIDHARGQPVGVVEISVDPSWAQLATDVLTAGGWKVHER